MVLSPSEESLINVLRALPAEEAEKVLNWAQALTDLGRGHDVQWSDAWSEQDVVDAVAASIRHFEDQTRKER